MRKVRLTAGLGVWLTVTIPRQSRGLSSCEPLKAADGVANAAPKILGYLAGSRSTPKV